MKLLFLTTPQKRTHIATDVRAFDGNVVKVSQVRGMKLLECYPDNFFPIPLGAQKLGEPVHPPLETSQITVLTIRYWPRNLLENNLLSYLPEEVELITLDNENNKRFTSASEALNYGIKKARNDIVICAHEDLIFRKEWFETFITQECRLKDWGVLGIVGRGFDTHIEWGTNYDVPFKVNTLDECCIILNRKNDIWFDEKTFTGWHCYGVDFCLQAYNKGLGVYVVNGPATHTKRGGDYLHSNDWHEKLKSSQELLREKWKDSFPIIATTTGIL